ncbi:hypothetical protein [Pseudomonas sp. PS01300]|uniref:hypothetical protein n=1 Tax=Pseudomonas sp. PS01300 TaxID=2991436 RepID=UPI00249BBD42|nr:hypothetical protein [Pseudomonas sp. PS01300]
MSNTEQMVSVPRVPTREMLNGVCMHPDLARSLWSALLKNAPKPSGQPMGWVYDGGQEFTSDPDRAHDLRAEGIELTAVYGHAHHQGEPVARVEIGADRNAALTITDENWLRSLKDHGAHQLVPLYANAGEVERLRASEKSLATDLAESLKQQCADMRTIDALRAQLAERDALLRIVREQGLNPVTAAAIRIALSASAEPIPFPGYPPVPEDRKLPAEPSAQVERDERAEFESAHVAKRFNFNRKTVLGMLGEYGNPYVQSSWEGWQARAALERMP